MKLIDIELRECASVLDYRASIGRAHAKKLKQQKVYYGQTRN